MTKIEVIRGTQTRAWRGVVRPAEESSFGTWITARWAPPERTRRMGPQRDFRTPRRSAAPWLALSTHVWQSSWQVMLPALPPVSSTYASQRLNDRRSFGHFRTPSYRAAAAVNWTSLLRASTAAWSSFPVRTLWNRIVVDRPRTYNIHFQVLTKKPQPSSDGWTFSRTLSEAKRTVVAHRASHFLFTTRTPGIRQDPDWQSRLEQYLTEQTRLLQSPVFQTITAFQSFAHTVNNFTASAGPLPWVSIREVHRRVQDQSRILTLQVMKPPSEENPRHPQLVLNLRALPGRTASRPSMQFAQLAASSQPEMLSAIRNMEKAISKAQASAMPAMAPTPDMQRLTNQVYDQLERQLRIERERRGR